VSSSVIKHHGFCLIFGVLFPLFPSTFISATLVSLSLSVVPHSFLFILLPFRPSFIISNPDPAFPCHSPARWLLRTTPTSAVYLASMFLLSLQDLRQPVGVAELTNMMTS
jgi:hypothetical protein